MTKLTKDRLKSRSRQRRTMAKPPVEKRVNFLPLLKQPTGKG